jgi:phage tail protein X
MNPVVTARQHDTLDLICWRHFGQTAVVTEMAMELNPGIASFGEVLPEGLQVTLPASAPPREVQTVHLWD